MSLWTQSSLLLLFRCHTAHKVIIINTMSSNGQSSKTRAEPMKKKIENYSYFQEDKLGSGYSSEVFRGTDERTNTLVAIKVVNLAKVRQKKLEDLLTRQIQLIRQVKHENVITCLDVLMTANNCYIVMEYADGDLGNLLAKKSKIAYEDTLKLIRGICQGLAYLHSKGVLHRDIKPQNILLKGNQPKIADFGFAIKSSIAIKERYSIGSPLYMSPQALNNRQYSLKNDVWALGVTIYQIVQGRAPWNVRDQKELKQAVKAQLHFRILKDEQMQQIIKGCLHYQNTERFTSQQALNKVQSIMGVNSHVSWSIIQNKENSERGNCIQQQNEQIKKSMRNNYDLLKWMINYSRFAAKLLPKIQQHLQCSHQIKEPFIQLTARMLHLLISKLSKVEQTHSQLALTHFPHFRNTSRFAKIKAVTAQYQQRYLLLLTKLPFRYYQPRTLTLDVSEMLLNNLQAIQINAQCSQQHLDALDWLITLIQVNLWARHTQPCALIKLANFEKLVETGPADFDVQRLNGLMEKQRKSVKEARKSVCD